MRSFLTRVLRAARFDPAVYEEVEADQSAFGQAFAVVSLSAIAVMIGVTQRVSILEIIAAVPLALVAWTSWTAVVYLVGVCLYPEPETRSDWGELLRTTGFATAPGILSILGVLPVFAGIAPVIAGTWVLFTFGLAVRQALDYRSTIRTIGVSSAGWLLFAAIFLVIR